MFTACGIIDLLVPPEQGFWNAKTHLLRAVVDPTHAVALRQLDAHVDAKVASTYFCNCFITSCAK